MDISLEKEFALAKEQEKAPQVEKNLSILDLQKISSDHDVPPRRIRENANEASPVAASAHKRRPHHHHKRGGIQLATQLTKEIATMAANMRSITNQNLAMQELLMQM